MKYILMGILLIIFLSCTQTGKDETTGNTDQNWTHYIRTSGHGVNKSNIERNINDALETHLFGIEVDNDPPGRYESFLDPTEKLEALEIMARRAHEIHNSALQPALMIFFKL